MATTKQLSKHTPGPWREKKYSLRVLAQVKNEDGGFEPLCVADCGQSLHLSSYLAEGEQDANARLITQAPEMYELLLNGQVAIMEGGHYLTTKMNQWLDEARRIKAEIDGE